MRSTYLLGMQRNVRQLIVLQNKLKIKYNEKLHILEVEKRIRDTYRKRTKLLKLVESLSLEYRTKLALAKEEAGECKAVSYICSLNRIETQRKLFQNIRVMEKN